MRGSWLTATSMAARLPPANTHTWAVVRRPLGRCRPAVRGLAASMRLSMMRLRAMASDRAPTMASRIQPSVDHGGTELVAMRAPAKANGRANTVCWKRTMPSSAGIMARPDAGCAAGVWLLTGPMLGR